MSLNRSFAFLRYPDNRGNPDDYLRNPDAATKVVQALEKMGVRYFLVLGDTIDDYITIGTAIKAAGLQFFSDERWSYEGVINNQGHFDSEKYLQTRIGPFLARLKEKFPATFVGFHLKDEPGIVHLENLGDMKSCLYKQPEFQGMKVFLNLAPIHMNCAGLTGLVPELADGRSPSDYGVDSSINSIVDHRKVKEMTSVYGAYVKMAVEKIKPDYLCFDLYPFSYSLATCTAARELTISENLSIVSANAQRGEIVPIAYLQNVQFSNDFYANFHHLRWFASWALTFGIQEFANFVSHDSAIDKDGLQDMGLLDLQNNETKLGNDQRSVFGFLRHIQHELSTFRYNRFVAPFIGVLCGDIVGWLPTTDILAGEYLSGDSNQVMIFFARRPLEGTVQTTVGLNAWYKTIEQLNVVTGQWDVIARSLNSIQITLDKFPGALYRLTK
jgi:hypothetical protein